LLLGMGDFSIFLVYILCIASALACVLYGIINWNKGAETEEDIATDKKWADKENKIKEELDV
jgi:hypothetical protein